MLIAIDFDGTCVQHAFPHVGPDFPHAAAVLKRFTEAGFKLILWTCRENHPSNINKRYLADAIAWFEKHDIPLLAANETPFAHEFREYEPRRKAYAHVYIDDSGLLGLPLTSGGKPNWIEIELIVFKLAAKLGFVDARSL